MIIIDTRLYSFGCNMFGGVTKVGVTDGVTFLLQKVMTFLVTVTTPTLRLSSVLVNSTAKIFRLSLGCHSWIVPPGAVPLSMATSVNVLTNPPVFICTRHH